MEGNFYTYVPSGVLRYLNDRSSLNQFSTDLVYCPPITIMIHLTIILLQVVHFSHFFQLFLTNIHIRIGSWFYRTGERKEVPIKLTRSQDSRHRKQFQSSEIWICVVLSRWQPLICNSFLFESIRMISLLKYQTLIACLNKYVYTKKKKLFPTV